MNHNQGGHYRESRAIDNSVPVTIEGNTEANTEGNAEASSEASTEAGTSGFLHNDVRLNCARRLRGD